LTEEDAIASSVVTLGLNWSHFSPSIGQGCFIL